jgi:flagellar basal-body rod protein FlgG
MNVVLALSLQSMQGDMARVDQVAMNLANALTPGYKRGMAVQAVAGASFAVHMNGAAVVQGAPVGVASPLAVSLLRDEQPGTVRSTGQPLDLALGGKGYFEVVTKNGPAYTRNGSFRLDAAGRLVTAQGYPVMGLGGDIVPGTATPVITATGAVLGPNGTADAPIAQLKVLEFDPKTAPERIGGGLLAATADMKQVQPQDIQVRQGFVENSNVSTTQEMTQLIQSMRHFEAMQRITQGYDEMLGTAIRKLGDNA